MGHHHIKIKCKGGKTPIIQPCGQVAQPCMQCQPCVQCQPVTQCQTVRTETVCEPCARPTMTCTETCVNPAPACAQQCAQGCFRPCAQPAVSCAQPCAQVCTQTCATTCATGACDHVCGQGCPRCETTRDYVTRQPTTVHEHVDQHGIITEVYEKPALYHTRVDHPATLVTHTVERSRLEEAPEICAEKVECVDVGAERVVSVQESGPARVVAKQACEPCARPVCQTRTTKTTTTCAPCA